MLSRLTKGAVSKLIKSFSATSVTGWSVLAQLMQRSYSVVRSSSDRSPRVGTCPNRTVTDSFHRPAFHFTGSIAVLDSLPLEQFADFKVDS